ncbi:hypothetical protein, conserved [Plasmodium gonderi]|uniref:Uncharacterized protein n=1 Tax=Plasmodium gonderi TaxID=77519 RepID=A0A1Y1JJT5_PLAGO|nr:hypothetical protein, conserved [Plasmodium gonderi]GAW82776.1 hypothetical protein, conserved [Plasmodium gonderi]
MIKKKSFFHEKAIRPIVSKRNTNLVNIRNINELKEELKDKIYTNIYSYNAICEGIYINRGINEITGRRNCGKTSLCSHICVNLFFNDLLHYFHLFYSTYFDFENFIENKSIENIFSSKTADRLYAIREEFILENKNFKDFKQLIKYFISQFIKLYGNERSTHIENIHQSDHNKRKIYRHGNNIYGQNHEIHSECFSRRRVIYVDLDNSFYIERYKNMIHASIEKIKKLQNRYMDFCKEKKCSLFLLLLECDKEMKSSLVSLYKKYSESYDPFINIFNEYLDKYINSLTFFDVFKNLQILKIFNFNELFNIIHFISNELQKYQERSNKYFNKYVPPDLGGIVLDNINYLYKIHKPVKTQGDNELHMLLKTLCKLSTDYRICVMITNNDNKYFKKKEEKFRKIYSKYVYNHIVVKFINEKRFFEFNFPTKKKKKNTDSKSNSSSDQSLNDLSGNIDCSDEANVRNVEEDDDVGHFVYKDDENDAFFKKRYNQRYIKIKKKKKTSNFCFFEINELGIETVLI